jgi:hypothetical protein
MSLILTTADRKSSLDGWQNCYTAFDRQFSPLFSQTQKELVIWYFPE